MEPLSILEPDVRPLLATRRRLLPVTRPGIRLAVVANPTLLFGSVAFHSDQSPLQPISIPSGFPRSLVEALHPPHNLRLRVRSKVKVRRKFALAHCSRSLGKSRKVWHVRQTQSIPSYPATVLRHQDAQAGKGSRLSRRWPDSDKGRQRDRCTPDPSPKTQVSPRSSSS